MTHPRIVLAVVTALSAASAPSAAQSPLPLGTTSQARLPVGEPSVFVFEARAAGFLTVVVRSEGGDDLAFTVTDDEGQSLPDGSADMDLGGNVGAEQLVVTLPGPGGYAVHVRSLGGMGGAFQIGGSFLESASASGIQDPDGRPSGAIRLAVGESHEDSIDAGRGDSWDWYRIDVTGDGALTVLTSSQGEGDLRLELYADGAFGEAMDASDQDMEGVLGNESITVNVRAGQTVYLRVTSAFGGGYAGYRIASGLIPG